MRSDPARLVQEWLEQAKTEGLLHSRGRFTIDAEAAVHLAGIGKLGLCDVPLLLLAGAVEAGSRYFRVHGNGNVRFSWEGPAGPSAEVAHSLLAAARVDLRWDERGFELPYGFTDYLGPLSQRGRHAPLELIWGNRLISAGASSPRMLVTPRRRGRLVLVDRGVDFTFPATFPGMDIVAWVDPLPGSPWPRQLLWSDKLRAVIVRIAKALHELPSTAQTLPNAETPGCGGSGTSSAAARAHR